MPLNIDLAHTTVSAGFAFTQSGCNSPIFPQTTPHCLLILTFTPTAAGLQTGTLSIASDDPVNPVVTVTLSGMGFISYPVPTLALASPPTVPIGSSAITLQVLGNNFFPASVVRVNGIAQPTTYISSTSVSATVSASAFTTLGEFPVTVFNPAPGGGESAPFTLTSYQTITMAASALVYNPTTSLLYAAIGTGAASNANTIAVVDPVTATVKQFLPVGNDPEKLALSGDGQFLYVGLNGDHKIQRINTATLTIDENFALPTLGGPLTVRDMKVIPGSPNSIVVALALLGSPSEAGIALFTSGALVNFLPDDFADHFPSVDSFDFAGTPSVVYSLPLSINGAFGVFTIDASGIHQQLTGTSGTTSQTTGSIVVSDGKLLYTNSGQIWNPAPQTLAGTYNPSLFFASSVVPVTSLGRTFFLDRFATFDDFQSVSVEAYDQKALTVIGTVPFLSATVNSTTSSNMVLWGTNGFAFIGGGSPATSNISQLILFRSSISGASAALNPIPALASLGTSSAVSAAPASR